MEKKGFPIMKSAVQADNKWISAYLETSKVGATLIELSNKAALDEIGIKIGGS